jgi:O-antigen/teichoic acid export membrane protein
MISRLLGMAGGQGGEGRLLVTSALWSVALRLVGMVVAFGSGVLLARYLGPSDLGIYGVALGIAVVLSAIGQLGLYLLATQEISLARVRQDWGLIRGVTRWCAQAVTAAGLLLGGGFLIAALAASDSPGFVGAALWAAPLVAVMALTLLVSAELRALDWLLTGQSLDNLIRPALIALLLVVFYAGPGSLSPGAAMAMNLAASLVALALGFWWLHLALPAEARSATPRREAKRWMAGAVPLAVSEVLRQLDGTYAVLVMGAVASSAETGIFRVALSTVVTLSLPLSMFNVVLAPTLARLYGEGQLDRLQKLLGIAAAAVAGSVALILLLLLVAGQWLVVAVFGAEYAGSWLPLMLLGLAQLIGGFFGVGLVVLGVCGEGKALARAYAISVTASIVLAVILAQVAGSIGVALAAIFGALLNNLIVWFHARRVMGLDVSPLGLVPALRPRRPGAA